MLAGNNNQIGMKQTQDLDAGKRAAYFAGDPFDLGSPVWSAAVAVGYPTVRTRLLGRLESLDSNFGRSLV